MNREDSIKQEFDYMLLHRLQCDCEYYLNNGNRNEKHLYWSCPKKQVEEMVKLYNKIIEKPTWLTLEQINDYDKKMNS